MCKSSTLVEHERCEESVCWKRPWKWSFCRLLVRKPDFVDGMDGIPRCKHSEPPALDSRFEGSRLQILSSFTISSMEAAMISKKTAHVYHLALHNHSIIQNCITKKQKINVPISKHHRKDEKALLSSHKGLGYGLDNWGIGIRFPTRQDYLSSLRHPERGRGRLSIPSSECQRTFPGRKAVGPFPGRKAVGLLSQPLASFWFRG